MFLSPLFRETLAGVTGAVIELYDTDGSVGAAKGAGIGAGIYKDNNEECRTKLKQAVSSASDIVSSAHRHRHMPDGRLVRAR